MERSLFAQIVEKFMPKLQKLVETINGKRNADVSYAHKELLRREYSPDQKWASASADSHRVAADMVAMDSPLSPKARPTAKMGSGELPKIGTARFMKESQINTIKIMRAQGRPFEQIVAKLTQDPVDCAVGIDERNEYNFLRGLSEGVVLIPDADDPSLAYRADYGYLESNIFGVETAGQITYDDVRRPINKADEDGNTITEIFTSKKLFTKIRQTGWAKELAANYRGMTIVNPSTLPVPSEQVFNDAFADDNNGVRFRVFDRSVTFEKNGQRKSYKAFNENNLIYLCDGKNIGALVWGELAEADEVNAATRSTAAIYTIVDEFKLIARYRTTNPYQEVTTGQALVLPVIENVDTIYMLKSDEAQEVDSEEEEKDTLDVKITIKGKTYTKSAVIAALNTLGSATAENAADSTVINHVNKLSAEMIASAEVSESES